MAYTGGELNRLNGAYGISAPHKSVPVLKLIKYHNPKSYEELYHLISYHFTNSCECGIKSQGTVEDFGKNLFDSQIHEWGHHKFSLDSCIQWEYNLFVINSLKGSYLEKKALLQLSGKTKYQVQEANNYIDEELRVDLILSYNNEQIAGIQVKPDTYNYIRYGVKKFNIEANKKWGLPVFYLYYDANDNFINFDEIINKIHDIYSNRQ